MINKSKTLFDKIWKKHIVKKIEGGPEVLYIDKHFIHEVTSPQAFEGLSQRGINVFRTSNTIATADHNVPTINQHLPIKDKLSKIQVETLRENCSKFGVELFDLEHKYQGIVHIIGPELGITKPGMTIVCGDSHTATHGAFGSIAFGIGTSEVEMVLASQCLMQNKPKQMRLNINGTLNKYVTAKDIILYIISEISSSGATGHFIEYSGSTIDNLSMDERMTICNMSIEMGARGGMIAPDETTYSYMTERVFAPKGDDFEKAKQNWTKLFSDSDAKFDKEYHFNAADIKPMITFGTNPGMGININKTIPYFENQKTEKNENSYNKALNYMGFKQGESLIGKKINYIFVGSCTNGRLADLRIFSEIVKGRKKAENIIAYIVPGSKKVEQQAKEEGIEDILNKAGFELRQPGCSACLAMNDDKVPQGEYCVSTSNRNFEGRQGEGSKTILASPLIAAVTAITGEIVDLDIFFISRSRPSV